MACDQHNLLHAYHDGQLDADRRDVVERHLLRCETCRCELQSLQRLSSLIAAAPLVEPSRMTIERLRRSMRRAQERSVRRLAGWLTAAAAAVLVAALVWRPEARSPQPVNPAVALNPPATTPLELALLASVDEVSPDTLIAAHWMAADLAGGRGAR